MQSEWKNPFENFLNAANAEFRKIPQEPEVHSNPSLVPSFVQLSEERSFVFDVVDRVQTLATAFQRLRNLYELYHRCEKEREQKVAAELLADPNRQSIEIPKELDNERDQYHREAQVFVAFCYYEMSTVVGLLKFEVPPGSHLEYLIGVRNKILAHPRRDGRVKNSRSSLSIGRILHAHLVGANGWIPVIRDSYLAEWEGSGNRLDDESGTDANVRLIRSKKRVEHFTDEEILRLKIYTYPEPDLVGSAPELAHFLESEFFVRVVRVCAERAKVSGGAGDS